MPIINNNREQAINNFLSLVSDPAVQLEQLMEHLYQLYPLPEIANIYHSSYGDKTNFLIQLLNIIYYKTTYANPTDHYLDILNLREPINNCINQQMQGLQIAAFENQRIFNNVNNFIRHYHRNEIVSHENLQAIALELQTSIHSNELTGRPRIRHLMRQGSKILLIKTLLNIGSKTWLNPTDEDKNVCDSLHQILASVQHEILSACPSNEIVCEDDFKEFAKIAFNLGESALLIDSIKYGARLFNDEFFIEKLTQLRADNNSELADHFQTLITNPDQPQIDFSKSISALDYAACNEMSEQHPNLLAKNMGLILTKLSELQKIKSNAKAKFNTAPGPYELYIRNIHLDLSSYIEIILRKDIHIRIKRLVLDKIAAQSPTECISNIEKLDLESFRDQILDPTQSQDANTIKKIDMLQQAITAQAKQVINEYFSSETATDQIPDKISNIFKTKNREIVLNLFKHMITSGACANLQRFDMMLAEYTKSICKLQHGVQIQNIASNEGLDLLCIAINELQLEKCKLLLAYNFPFKRTYKIEKLEVNLLSILMVVLKQNPSLINNGLSIIQQIFTQYPKDAHPIILAPDSNKTSILEHAVLIECNDDQRNSLTEMIDILLKNGAQIESKISKANILHVIAACSHPLIFSSVSDHIKEEHGTKYYMQLLTSRSSKGLSPLDSAKQNANLTIRDEMVSVISKAMHIFPARNVTTEAQTKAKPPIRSIVAVYKTSEEFNKLAAENSMLIDLLFEHLCNKMVDLQKTMPADDLLAFIHGINMPVNQYKQFLLKAQINNINKAHLLGKLFDELRFDQYNELYKLDQDINLSKAAETIFNSFSIDTAPQKISAMNKISMVMKYYTGNPAPKHADMLYIWAKCGAKDLTKLDEMLTKYTYETLAQDFQKLGLNDRVIKLIGAQKETFLHYIIKTKPQADCVQILNLLLDYKYPCMNECILFARDARGNNLFSLIEHKSEEWADVREILEKVAIEFINDMIIKKEPIFVTICAHVDFYNMQTRDNILNSLLGRNDYARILEILEGRHNLVSRIKMAAFQCTRSADGYYDENQKVTAKFKFTFNDINLMFGRNYLLDFKYKGDMLLNHFVREFDKCKNLESKTSCDLSKIMKSHIFRLTIGFTSILQTGQWHKIMYLSDNNSPEEEILKSLRLLKLHIDDYKMDINKTSSEATPLRQAILRNNLTIVKFLCDQLNARVDEETMMWTLTFPLWIDVNIIKYIALKYDLQSCNEVKIAQLLLEKSDVILLHSITAANNQPKLFWLLESGCSPNVKYDDGMSILQKLISLGFAGYDILCAKLIIEISLALLSNPQSRQNILQHRDNQGLTAYDYVQKLPETFSSADLDELRMILCADFTAPCKLKM